MECIGCANCIDACDTIMTKLNRPKGLVRYDSQAGLSGRKRRYIRPRIFIYGALMLVGAGAFTLSAMQLRSANMNIVRMTGAPYFITDTTVRNQYMVRVINKTTETKTYRIQTLAEGQIFTMEGNEEGIVVEPAGALTVAALDFYKEQIKDKNVVCILSGSNNDITRTEEIKERSLLYEGLKHYFVIRFPQRAGALRDFLNKVLGPTDDITHFEYTKKHNRDSGPALVGIQLQQWEDYNRLLERMHAAKIDYQTLNDSKMLFDLLV
jgi:threonine dehydratase